MDSNTTQQENSNYKLWAISCYAITGLLGLLAVVGWKIDVTWMFQFKPNTAPTQFNAAVCFLLLAIAALAYKYKANKLSLVSASASLLISSLSMLQYLFAIELFIDQLLHTSQITTFTSHPGRMAPNTALSFMIASSCLFWLVRQPKLSQAALHIIASLISMVFAISVVSVVGYMLDIKTSYGWGEFTPMSLQAALGFCFIAVGLLFTTLQLNKQSKRSDYHLSIIIGAALLSMTLLFTNAISTYQQNKKTALGVDNRDLVERDINLFWKADVIYFSKIASSKIINRDLQDVNLVDNQSIQAVYIKKDKNQYIPLFSREPSIDLSPLLKDRAYSAVSQDKISQTLGVRYSDLFSFNRDKYFALQLPLESSEPLATESLEVLVSYQLWLQRYAMPLLPDGAVIASSEVAESVPDANQSPVDNKLSELFPINVANLRLNLAYQDEFYQNITDITALVFWSGIMLTLLSVIVTFYAQKSRFKSNSLETQMKARKRFEEELRKSHLSLELAAKSADLGIWTWDVTSGELVWTQQMHEIYETPDDVIESGMQYEFWQKSVHPEDIEKAEKSLQQAVENQQDWQAEFRLLLSQGRVKHIKASAICYSDVESGRLTVIGANQDITTEKQLMNKLSDKTDVAEQNSQAKTKFLANMSHEIRTPMNAILGIGDLLKATKLDTKQYEYMKLIMSSANRLMDLINDILDISKIEAGELSIEKVCFPLEEVLADAAKTLANQAHQKGLDYHFFASADLALWVKSDPVRLSQILTNLVSNAIKFTEQGEVVVQLRSTCLDEQQRFIGLELCVCDTGIGIAESKVDSLFEPFSQADDSTTRKYGGTGLGLSIVRELVELLEGTINVESQLGGGTKITIDFKLELGNENYNSMDVSEDYDFYLHSDRNILGSLNCIVVDSHSANRSWLTEILHSWNCNVTACETAKQALDAIKKNNNTVRQFDAIVVESNLPVFSGFDFIKQLSAMHQQGKINKPDSILLLNASNLNEDLEFCKNMQVKAHLVKPIKQSEVFNALMTVLGKNPKKSMIDFPEEKVSVQQSLKILVAEDHEVNSFLVTEILEKRGHSVTVVENGRLAYEENLEYYYDAILMDVQMPVMDGIEATEMIRKGEQNSEVCIVGLTARALKEDAQVCLQAGMNYYLTKPVNPTELIEVLENEDIRSARQLVSQNKKDKKTVKLPVDTDLEFITFDEERALFTTESDITLLKKMLEMAAGFIDEAIEQHNLLLSEKNWDALAKKVHKTKGMVASFSHESLTQELEFIIEKIEARDFEQVGKLSEEANRRVKRLKQEITAYIHSTASEES